MENEIKINQITLMGLFQDGNYFEFCKRLAWDKGFGGQFSKKDAANILFSIGDYNAVYNYQPECFVLTHRFQANTSITIFKNVFLQFGIEEMDVPNELLKELKLQLHA